MPRHLRDGLTVEQVDDAGRSFAHALDERLVGQKIAAINGVVEVLVGSVAFALLIFRRVDAALRANRMRAFDRHDGKKVDRDSGFGSANGGHESGQTSTHDNDLRLSHLGM